MLKDVKLYSSQPSKLKAAAAVGKKGEALAAQALVDCGYSIIEQNYHSRYGELDIVAVKDDTLVFCEVKARSTKSHFALIDAKKIKKICKTAAQFLAKKYEEGNDFSNYYMRFDFMHVLNNQIHQHIENAWEFDEQYTM